jgi:Na+/melibiose symporter-like transporter
MKYKYNPLKGLKTFLILWATQMISNLGSQMTSFALIIWSYEQKGSALTTALLSICSYAPYIVLSIFAGALSDKWNKKYTMLFCDTFAAVTTVAVLALLKTGNLEIWHLYVLNALNGVMNTVQQPASDVSVSLVTPKHQYQRVSGLRAFSNSLVNILTPVIASAVLAFAGLEAVIAIDLITFLTAFLVLAFFIRIPEIVREREEHRESLLQSAKTGLKYLADNRGILDLMLFLAAINLTASMYNAALPAMVLSRAAGGQTVLGMINTCVGAANLIGSIMVSLLPAPKSRVRTIMNALLFSMSTENLCIALGRGPLIWYTGAVLGWLFIPVFSGNMDVLFRSRIPVSMQGRVFSARNTLQFFTIPLGYLLGGVLVDYVCEPLMAMQKDNSLLIRIFGSEKGSGAALLFFGIAILGIVTCLIFRRDKHIWQLEEKVQGL